MFAAEDEDRVEHATLGVGVEPHAEVIRSGRVPRIVEVHADHARRDRPVECEAQLHADMERVLHPEVADHGLADEVGRGERARAREAIHIVPM